MPLRACALAVFMLASTLLAVGPAARAQSSIDPARLAAAKEMMRTANVARQFEQVLPLLLDRLKESFRALAPDRRDTIDSVFEQMQKTFISRREELIDDIAAIYAQKLDADEINAIIAFYKSAAGAKFVQVQPQILQESMAAGQRWGRNIARELEEEARRELKRRGVDL